MGRLDKVLRISVSLPPFEIYCLFQEDNLFLNLSSIESQTPKALWGAPRGRPKYIVGRAPTLQPSSAASDSILSTLPRGIISLLFRLIFNPEKASNHINVQLKHISYSELASQKTIVSSAYKRWEMTNSPPSLFYILHPEIKLPSTARFSIQLSTSIPTTKRYGDSGSPCLRPLELWKKPAGEPLNKTENEAVEMHHRIHLIHFGPNPILSSVNSRKSHPM